MIRAAALRLLLGLLSCAPAAAQDLSPCPPGQQAVTPEPPIVLPRAPSILAIGSFSTSGAGASGPAFAYPAQLRRRLGGAATVLNAGKGGERAFATLQRMRALLAANRYDLVIWQVGVNDALGDVAPDAFVATLDEGVALIRAHGAVAALMSQQAFPDARDPERYARFVALVRAAAARHGVALLPRHAVMTAWDPETLRAMQADDRFHHNDRGYACLAALAAAALTVER